MVYTIYLDVQIKAVMRCTFHSSTNVNVVNCNHIIIESECGLVTPAMVLLYPIL